MSMKSGSRKRTRLHRHHRRRSLWQHLPPLPPSMLRPLPHQLQYMRRLLLLLPRSTRHHRRPRRHPSMQCLRRNALQQCTNRLYAACHPQGTSTRSMSRLSAQLLSTGQQLPSCLKDANWSVTKIERSATSAKRFARWRRSANCSSTSVVRTTMSCTNDETLAERFFVLTGTERVG